MERLYFSVGPVYFSQGFGHARGKLGAVILLYMRYRINWTMSDSERRGDEMQPVSYTHLTLPTIYSV